MCAISLLKGTLTTKEYKDKMNKQIAFLTLLCLLGGTLFAQSTKHDKKNLVVKEWNVRTGTSVPSLDHVTTYDSLGRKIEEIEYASYGQKSREVYEYQGSSRKVSRVIVYDDKNKVKRVKKYEYDAHGNRTRQLNYKPNGKLETTKTFEYIYQ